VTPARVPDDLEVVLLLAGGAERRSRSSSRIRELLAEADFDRLAAELAARRLLPLIGSRAIAAGGELVPQSFRDAVALALAAERANGLAFEWATRRVDGWLAAAGIRSLPLKGPALAAEIHDDVGMRSTSDVDVLVPEGELHRAAHVLVEHGFSPPTDLLRSDGLPDLHLVLQHPELPPVELHWRVHWYERAFSRDLLARAEPGPDGLLRPAPDDQAASLLLFYSRDGFHGVRQAADVAAWWDRRAGELSGAFLEGHTRRYPELVPALTAAARVVEEVTGTPATEWLGSGAGSGRRVDLATRLADWTQQGDREQLRANISLVRGLLGPPRSAPALVRRELWSFGAGPFQRAAHAAKTSARYALALWRVRGGRSWAPLPGARRGLPSS
jgi:hypothetical protein